jgi:hypothetical protein
MQRGTDRVQPGTDWIYARYGLDASRYGPVAVEDLHRRGSRVSRGIPQIDITGSTSIVAEPFWPAYVIEGRTRRTSLRGDAFTERPTAMKPNTETR